MIANIWKNDKHGWYNNADGQMAMPFLKFGGIAISKTIRGLAETTLQIQIKQGMWQTHLVKPNVHTIPNFSKFIIWGYYKVLQVGLSWVGSR